MVLARLNHACLQQLQHKRVCYWCLRSPPLMGTQAVISVNE